MLSRGTRVGAYRVVEHVGEQGTMADVYRAQRDGGREVALKLLREPASQARREADVVVGLHHPGIVRTYEVLEYDDQLCLVQEWVDGSTLDTVLARGSLGVDETIRLGRALASALVYAHSRGVLHRDIKPSNVLVSRGGDYLLADFGAVGLLDTASGRTQAGQIAGTPLYMSPEQAVGAPQSAASDLFGLGLLLFRCLHGTTPGESSENYVGLLRGRVTTPIEVPESPLRGLLQRCLSIDPARRPQSAQEVLDELDWLAGLLTVQYRAPSGAGDLGIPPSQWESTDPGLHFWERMSPELLEPLSRRNWIRVAAAAAVVVVLFVLAWLLAPASAGPGFWLRVGAGVVIVPVALLVAWRVRRLVGRSPDTQRQAVGILTGATSRTALTESMVLEVDQVVAKLKGLDAKFLGLTMVMLIREAEEAKESADRVAALVQMVSLMEKLTRQLSPWHVRHKEAIATGIAIVGSLAGVASVVSGFLR
jgi:hypothetical protein